LLLLLPLVRHLQGILAVTLVRANELTGWQHEADPYVTLGLIMLLLLPLFWHLQGILAVTVVRAKGLTGWQHEADPYVTLGLMQTAGEDSSSNTPGAAARLSMVEEQRSKTVYNEESPRYD
jgi:hypothetical protein